LEQQLVALRKASDFASESEKAAEECEGKWTHQMRTTSERYRLEMARQKHLHARRKFVRGELIHLEDDALDARLSSAREALRAVESEYKRMTGEALADSYGDTAAAQVSSLSS
jgi:hypothetical protein